MLDSQHISNYLIEDCELFDCTTNKKLQARDLKDNLKVRVTGSFNSWEDIRGEFVVKKSHDYLFLFRENEYFPFILKEDYSNSTVNCSKIIFYSEACMGKFEMTLKNAISRFFSSYKIHAYISTSTLFNYDVEISGILIEQDKITINNKFCISSSGIKI